MEFPPTSASGSQGGAAGFAGAAATDWGRHALAPEGPDPYRPSSAWRVGLAAITLVLLGTVVWMQRPDVAPPDRAVKAAAGLEESFVPSIEATLVAKIYFGTRSVMAGDPSFGQMLQDGADSAAGFPVSGTGGLGIKPPRAKEGAPPPPASTRLHAAVLAGETLGPEAALKRLDEVDAQLDPSSPYLGDVAVMRRVYGGEASAEVAASMSETERSEFVKRHGLFGRLVLSFGDAGAEARTRAATSGMVLLLVLMGFGCGAVAAGLVGLGMLIYMCVLMAGGRLRARFVPPEAMATVDDGPTSWGWGPDPQGRLIWLETVAVFLLGFLLLSVSGDVLGAKFGHQPWVALYSLLGQWLLVLTVFWPVARGMPFQRWRGELGWHRGEGIVKEIGAGLMAYVASLPLYFVAAIMVAIYIVLKSMITGEDAAPPAEENKLLDLAMSGNPLIIGLIFLLATLWAPVVEESIFRGSLYRHMRWRLSPLIAAILTATVFAIMHGYAVIQLFMVGLLGLVFALMREWRGSLIAPMTAHFTHNTVVMTFVIILFGQLGS